MPGVLEPTAILRAERPTISFYRYLYDTVGADWNWFMRRRLSDEELAAIIHDDRDEVFVLHVRGVPAGYVELDRRVEGEVEIAYFGLIPEYVGRGFGKYLLAWGLARAWSYRPRRVWLHTCTLDHPGRLASISAQGSRCTTARRCRSRWSTCSSSPGNGRPRARRRGRPEGLSSWRSSRISHPGNAGLPTTVARSPRGPHGQDARVLVSGAFTFGEDMDVRVSGPQVPAMSTAGRESHREAAEKRKRGKGK